MMCPGYAGPRAGRQRFSTGFLGAGVGLGPARSWRGHERVARARRLTEANAMPPPTQVPVPTTPKPAAASRPVIWKHGVVVAVAAAATTTALAAVASAAGVSFA